MIDFIDQSASGGAIFWRVATHGGELERLCLGGGRMKGMLMEMEGMAGGIYREVGEGDEAPHDYPVLWITRISWTLG